MGSVRFVLCFVGLLLFTARSQNELKENGPPIIDFGHLTYDLNSIPKSFFEQIDRAFREHGVFIAVNHNIFPHDQSAAFQASKNLFDLPQQVKDGLSFNESHYFGRGYLGFGSESGLSEVFEPKEGYSFGHPKNKERISGQPWLKTPNRWPADWNTENIKPFDAMFEKFSSMAEMLLSYIIYARKFYKGKVTNIMAAGGSEISLLRLFHYFPLESELVQSVLRSKEREESIEEHLLGSSPHTDWGLLTIILQNGVTGLQYRHGNRWVDVPYVKDSLVFNCGDYFQIATHGEYHSPVHRVLTPKSQERTSFVFFFYPHYDSPLTSQKTVPSQAVTTAQDGTASSVIGNKQESQTVEDKGSDLLNYNTLTVLNYEDISVLDYDKNRTQKFGDYIIKKWRDVYRSGY